MNLYPFNVASKKTPFTAFAEALRPNKPNQTLPTSVMVAVESQEDAHAYFM